MSFWMKTRSSIHVPPVDVLIFIWIGTIVFIGVQVVINLWNPQGRHMQKETKANQKLESSKTSQKTNFSWTIDYINTSDVGYPEQEDERANKPLTKNNTNGTK
jgi:hypothetical protein